MGWQAVPLRGGKQRPYGVRSQRVMIISPGQAPARSMRQAGRSACITPSRHTNLKPAPHPPRPPRGKYARMSSEGDLAWCVGPLD